MQWPWKKKEAKPSIPLDQEGKLKIKGMELTSKNISGILGVNKDVKFRDIYINAYQGIKTTMVFIEGLVDDKSISEYILAPLVRNPQFRETKNEREIVQYIKQGNIYFAAQNMRTDINDVILDILSGHMALIFDGSRVAFTFSVQGFDKRSITEPVDENVMKGSKDSFVETLRVNTATIRRKIKSHNLIVDQTTIGKQTLTQVAIIYMDNIANKHIIEEIKQRLDSIDIDGVLAIDIIIEYLTSPNISAFPQTVYTERPDKFCANIVEGRVGLIIDGIAGSLIFPATLLQFMQAPEDYAQNYIVSSIIRLLRYAMLFITLYLPGFYISVTTFHHEMIPTELALSIQNAKQGVPFPSPIEIIGMLIAFEILLEAGLRLPKTIGQAVSIVGALVVGQAAAAAKLVSPAVVMVIAVAAIASFTMPNQDFSNALRLWRFINALLCSALGLFGLGIGGVILIYHLCRIENYGVPYLSPFVSGENAQFQDTVLRLPIRLLKERPYDLRTINSKRQR